MFNRNIFHQLLLCLSVFDLVNVLCTLLDSAGISQNIIWCTILHIYFQHFYLELAFIFTSMVRNYICLRISGSFLQTAHTLLSLPHQGNLSHLLDLHHDLSCYREMYCSHKTPIKDSFCTVTLQDPYLPASCAVNLFSFEFAQVLPFSYQFPQQHCRQSLCHTVADKWFLHHLL